MRLFPVELAGRVLADRLVAERERWPLWLPLFLSAGIGIYFSLSAEPSPWAGPAALACITLAAWVGRRHWAVVLPAIALATMALGFSAAQLRTHLVSAPVLERTIGPVAVTGTVEEVELLAEGGGRRVTLSAVTLPDGIPEPARVRIRLRTGTVAVGERVRIRAVLSPPQQPVAPGAFDFARHAWFLRLGAVGYAVGEPEPLPSDEAAGWGARARLTLNAFRNAVTARILAAIPGPEGGVAAALVTGETAGIPQQLLEDYRDSGLAHLLSISGLHMSLVAGLVFFVVRGGLALVPAVALTQPIKKWAAAVALAGTWGYMMMAGAPVPAQRAFLMTGIVLAAVLLDRRAVSMRLVAWAAVLVLLVQPEALVGPSFQMSFAAVAALVAAYEVATPRLARWRGEEWWRPVVLYVAGVLLSTLVAGTATAVYGLYHFNRVAVYSLMANLLAVPLTGFVVMPCALVALLLMPLGLEALALVPMGWGVEAVDWVAAWVAGWPGAAIALPVMPLWGLVLFTLGGAWLCLWRTSWRLWGLVPLLMGLGSLALSAPPHMLVDGRGQAMAVRAADGSLLMTPKGGRILKESWSRRAGAAATERWPKEGRSNDGRLSCGGPLCVYRLDNRVVALVREEAGLAEACGGSAEVVVSAVPVRQACAGAKVVVDRFDLWRKGAHALWLEPAGVRLESMAEWQGQRPWSHKPVRRKKKVEPAKEKEKEKDEAPPPAETPAEED